MRLIELNINQVLLLDNYKFNDSSNNIEFLNQQALITKSLDERLNLLSRAASLVEKFHSFFHFEQSYFHLLLAKNYLITNQNDFAAEELRAAIFQDHINYEAQDLLNNKPPKVFYERLFKSFAEYISFASGEAVTKIVAQGYWTIKADTKENINEIINRIREHHQNYHIEAAKIYLNRALIFYNLHEANLAKNDIIKANNLDSNIKSKIYFNEIISQMGKVTVLGLGSNLGDRMFFLNNAIKLLEDQNILKFITKSSIKETKAALLEDSPPEWDLPYLNMVIKGVTDLTPEELIERIGSIERQLGRDNTLKWSPRNIDIDILSYDDIAINTERTQIPHPRLLERPWVIKHFVEVFPDWRHPLTGKIIKDYL